MLVMLAPQPEEMVWGGYAGESLFLVKPRVALGLLVLAGPIHSCDGDAQPAGEK